VVREESGLTSTRLSSSCLCNFITFTTFSQSSFTLFIFSYLSFHIEIILRHPQCLRRYHRFVGCSTAARYAMFLSAEQVLFLETCPRCRLNGTKSSIFVSILPAGVKTVLRFLVRRANQDGPTTLSGVGYINALDEANVPQNHSHSFDDADANIQIYSLSPGSWPRHFCLHALCWDILVQRINPVLGIGLLSTSIAHT
jgi:hypothetical protein